MKKLIFLTVAMVTALLFAVQVQAQSINNTGPDSNNTVDQTVNENCNVSNQNNVNVDNTTNQDSTTGPTESSNNTNGGHSSSGDASNNNTTNTDILIDNQDSSQVCVAATPQSQPNVQPSGGYGGGAGESAPSTKPVAQISAVPTGGVGAGTVDVGDMVRTIGLLGASFAAIAIGTRKLQLNSL